MTDEQKTQDPTRRAVLAAVAVAGTAAGVATTAVPAAAQVAPEPECLADLA